MAYNSIQYVPPAALHQIWPDIQHFVEESAEYDSENVWIEDIYALLKNGTYLLHIGKDFHGMTIAMAISQVQLDPWDNAKRFMVIYAHGEHNFLPYQAELEKVATELGCEKICFRSPRKGWLKVAPEAGYDLAFMQFEKRL